LALDLCPQYYKCLSYPLPLSKIPDRINSAGPIDDELDSDDSDGPDTDHQLVLHGDGTVLLIPGESIRMVTWICYTDTVKSRGDI
jgi:hypothetical protein